MASIVGVHFGRWRWPGTQKTVEGSAAAAASMLLLLWLIDVTQGGDGQGGSSRGEWGLVTLCTCGVCVLEAFTTQIDNLFLPLVYYAALLSLPQL